MALFCFDLILLVFFLKLYSDAQYVSSKALLSSLQLMNIVMALGKKPPQTIKIKHMLLFVLIATLFII